MKLRGVLVIGAFGLAFATMTLALQPAAGQRATPSREKSKLRAELATLRAEVELLELEHEADRPVLSEMIKEARQFDSELGKSALVDAGLMEKMRATALSSAGDASEKLQKMQTPEGEKSARSEIEKTVNGVVQGAKADIERRKKEFLKRTTELNLKRLELADAEKRYNGAN